MSNLKSFLVAALCVCAAVNNAQAQLNWSGTQTYTSGANIAQNINLTGNVTIDVASGATVTISGVISSSAAYTVTKTGTGNLYLTGNNTYTGTTTISAGIVRVGNSTTTGAIAGNIVNNAILSFSRTNAYTYGGVISGSGDISKGESSTLTLTGVNTCTGTVFIFNGTFALSAAGSINNAVVDVDYPGKFDISAGNKTIAALKGSTGYAEVILGSRTLTIGTTDAFAGDIYKGVISGTGGIIKTGTNMLTLTGINTYTGSTTISQGTLIIERNDIVNITGNITNNATLQFNILGSGNSYTGVISGTGNVVKKGAGTIYLENTHTYTGSTTIDEGRIFLNKATSDISTSSGVIINGSGSFYIDSAANSQTIKSLNGTSTNAKVELYFGAALTIGKTGENNGGGSFAGSIESGGRKIIKTGTATLTLNGDNKNMEDLTISEGTLVIGTPCNLGAACEVTLEGSGIFDVSSAPREILDLNSSSSASKVVLGNHTLTIRVDRGVFAGIFSGIGGVTIENYGEPTDFFTLSGANTATGTLTCEGKVVLQSDWKGSLIQSPTSVLTVSGSRLVNGTLLLQGGVINFDLSGATPSCLTAIGVLLATTDATTINITNLGTAGNYTLLNAASGVSVAPFTLTGAAGTLSTTGTSLIFIPSGAFVPVTDITGVPTAAPANIPLPLAVEVVPVNATNQTIVWSVKDKGGTGAFFTAGNVLNTSAAGTAVITATIESGTATGTPFSKDFIIAIGDVGIEQLTIDNGQLRIYPNPTSGELRISLPNLSEGGAYKAENVEIYDIIGRVALSAETLRSLMTLTSLENGEITIDVSSLANGMYFLKIGNQVIKFIKE